MMPEYKDIRDVASFQKKPSQQDFSEQFKSFAADSGYSRLQSNTSRPMPIRAVVKTQPSLKLQVEVPEVS